MYVCLCHGISDRRIKSLLDQGCSTVKELQKNCKAGSNCGMCLTQLKELTEARKSSSDQSQNQP